MELEKRYRELTDLLVIHALVKFHAITSDVQLIYALCMYIISFQYYKQTQLETMASEKAAAEFQLEKEYKRLQEAQVCHLRIGSFGCLISS